MIDPTAREVMHRIDVGPNPIQMIARPDGDPPTNLHRK
ncbi:hypothetical protein [Paracoccus sp. Z118]